MRTVPDLEIGSPELLFELADSSFFTEATSPDGRQFLVARSTEEEEPQRRIVYVPNWFDELERIFAGVSSP